jgi:uncharacterized delta-60 repeat protein
VVTGKWGNLSHRANLELTVVPTAPHGSLDSSFDQDGRVITDVGGSGFYDEAYAVELQPDGKIVVAGTSKVGSENDFSLARYNPDGSLDTSFDSDGKLTTDFGGHDEAHALALQPDGKIVVVGQGSTGTKLDFALARYNQSGSLDTTFDSDGKVTTDFGEDGENAWCVALQPDGKIVVAGQFGAYLRMARYLSDGSLDTSFDGDGKVSFLGVGTARAIALLPNGKILLAGSVGGDFGLFRYNADGSLDTSFDTDGWVGTDFGGNGERANAMAIQSDGKIVLAGKTPTGFGGGDFALARYNPDGSLDTSFGAGGKLTTDLGGYDEAYSLAIQKDGKIVAVGQHQAPNAVDFVMARYNSNGSLDSGFDGDGMVFTDMSNGGNDVANSVVIQPNGRILLAGFANGDFGLARYWP